jgi:AcrR family transcriptional regulator
MAAKGSNRRGDKRAQIVDAAADLFNRFGLRRVTVEEICRKAGTSKMTFYKHFANKVDVFKYIWNDLVDQAYKKVDEIDAMSVPFPEKLHLIFQYKMGLMSQMSPELLEDLLGGDPEILSFMTEIRKRSFALFLEFAERAQKRGDMRKVRPELFMAALEKMGELAHNTDLRNSYPDNIDFARDLNGLFFYGLLPREGSGDKQ